jgi:hypothetical protein
MYDCVCVCVAGYLKTEGVECNERGGAVADVFTRGSCQLNTGKGGGYFI